MFSAHSMEKSTNPERNMNLTHSHYNICKHVHKRERERHKYIFCIYKWIVSAWFSVYYCTSHFSHFSPYALYYIECCIKFINKSTLLPYAIEHKNIVKLLFWKNVFKFSIFYYFFRNFFFTHYPFLWLKRYFSCIRTV